MPAGKYNFTIERGATFDKTLTWKDSSRTPVPLAGWTGELEVGSSFLPLATAILGDTDGTIRLVLTASETATLAPGNRPYRLALTRSDGFVKYLLKGTVTIS